MVNSSYPVPQLLSVVAGSQMPWYVQLQPPTRSDPRVEAEELLAVGRPYRRKRQCGEVSAQYRHQFENDQPLIFETIRGEWGRRIFNTIMIVVNVSSSDQRFSSPIRSSCWLIRGKRRPIGHVSLRRSPTKRSPSMYMDNATKRVRSSHYIGNP